MFARFFVWSIAVSSAMLLTGCASPNVMSPQVADGEKMPQVCSPQHCRTVEIADEVPEQQKGLMNRTQMDEDKGMLFVFQQIGSWQFWMKDTLLALDMLWLDGGGKIVYIATDVPPCKEGDACPGYGPTEKSALYVLELNAGQAMKKGLSTGMILTLPTP